jgi:hypothetical protein
MPTRRFGLLVTAVLLLGVVVATPVQADVVDGGSLTSGQSVTGTVSEPGRDLRYTFAGTKLLHVMFDVSATGWGGGAATLRLYRPDGSFYDDCPVTTPPLFCEITPEITGTWAVVLDPVGDAVGSTTFTYTSDQDNGPLTTAVPVTAGIAVPGQGANYVFTGTKGVHLSLNVTAADWGAGGRARIYLFSPAGRFWFYCDDSIDQPCGFTVPTSGTWTVTVDPVASALGSTTFALMADPPRVALRFGRPVTARIAGKGQLAEFTFAAVAGRHIVVDVRAVGLGTGRAGLYLYGPDGQLFRNYACNPQLATEICEFYPTMTGTWTVSLRPYGDTVGSISFAVLEDLDKGTLHSGAPVTTTISTRGRNADYRFTAGKGIHISFDVTATNWGRGGSARLNIYHPNGTLYESCPLTTARRQCETTPNAPGRWRVSLDPTDVALGSTTFTYAADLNRGRLSPGVPVSTTIAVRGQNATYRLPVTNRKLVKLTIRSAHWSTRSGARLYVFPPRGRPLFTHCAVVAATVCAFTPTKTGTWTVRLDPIGAGLGSTRFVRT